MREGDARDLGGAWRRVRLRMTTRFLGPSRSVDDKAIWAARVPRRRSGSEESEAARGRFSGAN